MKSVELPQGGGDGGTGSDLCGFWGILQRPFVDLIFGVVTGCVGIPWQSWLLVVSYPMQSLFHGGSYGSQTDCGSGTACR